MWFHDGWSIAEMNPSIHAVAVVAPMGFLVMFMDEKLMYSISKLPHTLYPKSAFYASFSGAEIVPGDQCNRGGSSARMYEL